MSGQRTRTAPHSQPPPSLRVGWYTSLPDSYSHAVTDEAFVRGVRQQRGQFRTVCGQVICLADSAAPCGRDCPRCAALVRAHLARHQPPADTEALRPHLGWLRWIVHRHGAHA